MEVKDRETCKQQEKKINIRRMELIRMTNSVAQWTNVEINKEERLGETGGIVQGML